MVFQWRVAALFLFSAAIGGAGPSSAAERQTWKTRVNGALYRVTIDRDVVIVAKKSIISARTMQIRDEMRIAVRQATGCELTDELWFEATLKGRLSCPEGKALSTLKSE